MCGIDPISARLITAVREHALDNYNQDGWDYVVESFDDDQILELIVNATDEQSAIEAVEAVTKILDDRRKDIQAEIF